MNIIDLITNQMGNPDILNQLGQTVGASPEQVQKLTQMGLPTIMEALNRNSNSPEGAQALAGALDNHQGADLSDLAGFLKNVDTKDGASILQHVFGDRGARVQNNLANQTGMDTGQVSGILSQLAPLVMGALGQQKKEQNLDAAGVSDLTTQISGMLGQGSGGGIMGIASQLLDADHDGSIVDDLGNLLGGLLKRK